MPERPELTLDVLDQLVDLGAIRDVGLVEGRPCVPRARIRSASSSPASSKRDVAAGDVRTFLGERERDAAPDPALVRGARDERDLAVEPSHYAAPSCAAHAFSNPSLPRRDDVERILLPERVLEVLSEKDPSSEKISRSNQPSTPPAVERAEDRRQVDDPVAGQHPVEVVARLGPPVADVDARDDPVAVRDGVLDHVVRVPEVVDVVEELRRSARRSRPCSAIVPGMSPIVDQVP